MNRKGRKKWPPLTPPGSISLERFKDKCTGCQICVVRCPSQVLRPTGLEYGLDYMLKPRLAYISSYCNYECTVCSDVCPTGAIKPLTIEEKTTTQVALPLSSKAVVLLIRKRKTAVPVQNIARPRPYTWFLTKEH